MKAVCESTVQTFLSLLSLPCMLTNLSCISSEESQLRILNNCLEPPPVATSAKTLRNAVGFQGLVQNIKKESIKTDVWSKFGINDVAISGCILTLRMQVIN